MTPDELYEWADMHGFYPFRCPECGKRSWTDTVPVCDRCGWDSTKDEEEEEQ